MNLKIVTVALNQTPMDWSRNSEQIADVLDSLPGNTGIVLFPELCITGYGCEDQFHSPSLQEEALQILSEVVFLSRNRKIVVCVGLPILFRNALYNTVAVIQSGQILGFAAKQHLAGDGLHYEPRWFRPWPPGVMETIDLIGRKAPIGDIQFNVDGVRFGFEVCEDAWVAERPGSKLARRGVDIILNPSASHFAFGKHETRKRFVIEGSRAFNCTYVYANLLGNEAGRAIYDGGCMIATKGALVAEGGRFMMTFASYTCAVVDVEATRTQQARTASFTPSFDDVHEVKGTTPLAWTKEPVSEPVTPAATPSKFEEFTQAETLGLFDYLRKSGSKGFALSLSGGVDSTVCAMLVKLMVDRGMGEFNKSFCEGLSHLGIGLLGAKSLVRELLTCVYQSSDNSGDVTKHAARIVAEDIIKAKFVYLSISPMVRQYTEAVSQGLQRELSWETDDIALQNIQARVRAPSVWMIANLENKLLLTTSNRSEAAVGYCTMDGDTAGSIAPIAGVDKEFLIEWLIYQSRTYPELECVTQQEPTAELRPGQLQTDETDLMPYRILEEIETLAIMDKKGPVQVYRHMRDQDKYDFPSATLKGYIKKFFQMWCRNQWKRERYALSFHLDDRNLDPRSWCRFPVLSGAFVKELRELEDL